MRKILLILLFVFTLFAGESEEIGVPYLNREFLNNNICKKEKIAFSLEGDYMYTLQSGLITVYQTNPIKKVDSFNLNIDFEFNDDYSSFFVTQDKKRIIVRSNYVMQLWDIQTNKCLKSIKRDSSGYRSAYTADGLVLYTSDTHIEVLSDKNLEVIRASKHAYDKDSGCSSSSVYRGGMYVNGDQTALLYLCKDIGFIDLKNFEILDRVEYGADASPYVKKYSDNFGKNLSGIIEDKIHFSNSHLFAIFSQEKQVDLNGFEVQGFSNPLRILKYLHKDKRYSNDYLFIQLDDEWLLMESKTRLFTGSKNIKKYLQMKMKDGTVIPINQSTFEKYNTQINLKD